MNLDYLRLFQRILALGSMAAAAREAGLSTSTVSDRLAALEEHYGVALLNRTTRSLRPTEAGHTLLEGLESLLEEANALDHRIRHGFETLSGIIRISAPDDVGRTLVSPVIDQFQTENPEVRFELHLSDSYVDIVHGGYDVALRFGDLPESALRIRRFNGVPRIVCASPEYITVHGRPEKPNDLASHQCLLMRFGDMLDNRWTFTSAKKLETVVIHGHRIASDGSMVRQWCLDGKGIALKSILNVADDLSEGRLVALLQDYSTPDYPLQMIFPPDRNQPKRVQAFSDALARSIKAFRFDISDP